jgi:hypothetical protein
MLGGQVLALNVMAVITLLFALAALVLALKEGFSHKLSRAVALLVVALIVQFVWMTRFVPRFSSFALVASPGATGISFKCVRGCYWIKTDAHCDQAPCAFVVDEHGIRSVQQPAKGSSE